MGSGISTKAAVIAAIPRRTSKVFKPKPTWTNGKPHELTKTDCDHLKKSWALIVPKTDQQLEIMHDFGIEIYEEVFTADPDLMKSFPTLRSSAKKMANTVDLRQVPSFRNQAIRLVDMLATSVDCCETLGTLESRFRDIGRRHQMYVKELTKDHFRLVEQATLVVVQARLEQHRINNNEAKLDDQMIQEMTKAWGLLMGYIVYHINAGYVSDEK